MLDLIDEFDKKLFLFLNSKHSPFWDDFMWYVSGNRIWIPLYVVLLIVIIYRDMSYRFIFTILFVALAVFLSVNISVLIKFITERPRPTHNYEIAEMVHTVRGYVGREYGFVSSHAANVFCAAAFLSNQFKNYKWGLFLFSWAIVVSYSRIYLGVHYPLDIIFGAILGALIGIQCYVFKVRTSVYFERNIQIRKEKKIMKKKMEEKNKK